VVRVAWVRDFVRAVPYLLTPRTMVLRRFSRALGDNLMLTHLARRLRARWPGLRIVVETNWPELFWNNPHVAVAVRSKVAPRYVRPAYRIDRATQDHILDQLARSVGLPDDDGERAVEVYLSQEEREKALEGLPRSYVVICPVGKRTVAGNRKDWGFERFQQVVRSERGVRFVQIGSRSDPLLEGVIDRRGLPIRASAAVLEGAETALLLEGGLMHLARAVNTSAIVIYGGTVAPEVSCYHEHLNVAVRAPCGPCFRSHGRVGDCHRHECMAKIRPELVQDLLSRVRSGVKGVVEIPW